MKSIANTENIKVLVIDDDEHCRELLVTILKMENFDTASVAEAETALELLQKEDFDAVVSDISLPGMSGIDLLMTIRKNDSDLPVILITGYSSLDTAVNAVKQGAQDYLMKPLGDCSGLVRSISSAVKHYRETLLQRQMEHMLTETVELERQALGRELHDVLSQDLASISMLASMLTDSPDAVLINELAVKCISCVKCLSSGLFPVELETEGLGSAVLQLVKRCQTMTKTSCNTELTGVIDIDDEHKALHIFRIVQEAFRNALKHSNASNIQIKMTGKDGSGVISVTDDGLGIPESIDYSNKMGIHIMKCRANIVGADLRIESNGICGTKVTCSW